MSLSLSCFPLFFQFRRVPFHSVIIATPLEACSSSIVLGERGFARSLSLRSWPNRCLLGISAGLCVCFGQPNPPKVKRIALSFFRSEALVELY